MAYMDQTKGELLVSEHTYAITELVGSSTSSIDDAIRNAISRPARR
jgi:flavin-binding protein dodecin